MTKSPDAAALTVHRFRPAPLDVGAFAQDLTELALRPPDPLGDCPHPALPPGEQGDDPVGLTELRHPQHNSGVAVDGHPIMVPPAA